MSNVRYNQLHNQLRKLVEIVSNDRLDSDQYAEAYATILDELYNLTTTIEGMKDNIAVEDLNDFIESLDLYNNKSLQYEDIKVRFDSRFLVKPYSYDFYFRAGLLYGYEEQVLGDADICGYAELPEHVKENIDQLWQHYDSESSHPVTDNWRKMRKSAELFLHIKVQSIGPKKARDKTFSMIQKGINILNFAYRRHAYLASKPDRHEFFDFCMKSERNDKSVLIRAGHEYDAVPYRNPYYTIRVLAAKDARPLVFKLTLLSRQSKKTKLQERILDAIDTIGMISNDTPLHIRVLLCVISLEGLLLSKGDKDYLGWKLAEKVAFLIGDHRECAVMLRYGLEWPPIIDENFVSENLVVSRRKLEKKVRAVYEHRSAFSHGEASEMRDKKSILSNDYFELCLIVEYIIDRLMQLGEMGITHIQKKSAEDTKSLDEYVAGLKYG